MSTIQNTVSSSNGFAKPVPAWSRPTVEESPALTPRDAIEIQVLAAKMFEVGKHCSASLGIDAPLTSLIKSALASRDLQQLKLAEAAFNGQPDEIKRRIRGGWTRSLIEPTQEDLLAASARKPVRYFLQIDGEKCEHWDDVWSPDDEGYGVIGGGSFELRNHAMPVRVQIAEGTKREDALALLKRIVGWLEKDWDYLVDNEAVRHRVQDGALETLEALGIDPFDDNDPRNSI
jgi:hypothetical protein